MSESLTEKEADIAKTIDTTTETAESTNGHGEAHLPDGALLEEMKKAVKQSVFFFSVAKPLTVAHFFSPLSSKKSRILFRRCQPSL